MISCRSSCSSGDRGSSPDCGAGLSIGSPPILPSFSICCKPCFAVIRKSSKNFTPKKRTTSAGTTYSPSDNWAGTSSRTSLAKEPGGTSLPDTGSRVIPSSAIPPSSNILIWLSILTAPPSLKFFVFSLCTVTPAAPNLLFVTSKPFPSVSVM